MPSMAEMKTIRATITGLRRAGPAPRCLCLECIVAWETGENDRECERCSAPEPGRCNSACRCTELRREMDK